MYRDEAQSLTNHCLEQGDLVEHWGCIVEPHLCGYYDEDNERTPPELTSCVLHKFGQYAQDLLKMYGKDTVYLLNEQYVVKPPNTNQAKFGWHQDILYLTPAQQQKHRIVSVWTPLDDVDEGNGTIMIMDPHTSTKFSVYVPAGSAVFMDGTLSHCSAGNHSSRFRSVFMPQFSLDKVVNNDDTCTALAIPIQQQSIKA